MVRKEADMTLKAGFHRAIASIYSSLGVLYQMSNQDIKADMAYRVVLKMMDDKFCSEEEAMTPLQNYGCLLWKMGDQQGAQVTFLS